MTSSIWICVGLILDVIDVVWCGLIQNLLSEEAKGTCGQPHYSTKGYFPAFYSAISCLMWTFGFQTQHLSVKFRKLMVNLCVVELNILAALHRYCTIAKTISTKVGWSADNTILVTLLSHCYHGKGNILLCVFHFRQGNSKMKLFLYPFLKRKVCLSITGWRGRHWDVLETTKP